MTSAAESTKPWCPLDGTDFMVMCPLEHWEVKPKTGSHCEHFKMCQDILKNLKEENE